jgi:hypothetical protein
MTESELMGRLQRYCQGAGLALGERLGSGVQGIVVAAQSQAESGKVAVKVHDREEAYRRERDVYLRLRERGVSAILGCAVPQLLGFDDHLRVIEMTFVTPPFVLDFGGAHLEQAPQFSDEVLADWAVQKQEQFAERWPRVQAIMRSLEAMGVFLEDVNPQNINFGP